MKKLTILVLGVHGMVGHTVYTYLSSNPRLTVFGTIRKRSRIKSGMTSLRLSVESAEKDVEKIYKTIGKIDFIINCIGEINKDANKQSLVLVNSWFPHLLEHITKRENTRLIHISTDAVFGKLQGKVTERTTPIPDTLYGMSKLLGETEQTHALTIRTSFIGTDIKNKKGIIEQIRSGKTLLEGYSNQIWSGCTTVQFAQLCELLTNTVSFENIRKKTAFIHFFPLPKITKYMLMKKIVSASGIALPVKKTKKEKTTRILHSLFPFFTSSYENALEEILLVK